MPFYEYKCDDCGREEDRFFHMGQAAQHLSCSCGKVMRRVFSAPVGIHLPTTGRDKTLMTLNKEGNYSDFPGGEKNRRRYEKAFARGLESHRRTIGRGF